MQLSLECAVPRLCVFTAFFLGVCGSAQDRITGSIDASRKTPIRGGAPGLARAEFDRGPVDPSRKLGYVTMHLAPSAAQQAELETLLEQQRDPASPSYRKWLAPEQFAERFGASRGDMAKVAQWLESEGLTIERQSRGRNWIAFSGTAAAVGRALQTEFHRYVIHGEEHFANSTAPSVPAALDGIVTGLVGLNDFGSNIQPHMTNPDGTNSIAPDDIATIYDITPLYNMGIDGTGQIIAIAGSSELEPHFSDIRAFQAMFNLNVNLPQVVTVGPSPGLNGAVLEADLDIEWSTAVARGAYIVYVQSSDIFQSAIYAVDQNLAPVINLSAGACEAELMYLGELYRSIVQQANAQGITFLAASGDAAAAACDGAGDEPVATNGLAVTFPASIPEVTAVGGTEFNENGGAYWSSTNTANGASALSYIPEKAWDDSLAAGVILGSGGGASILYSKPAWQTGPGIPNDNARDVPDVSLAASNYHDPFNVCTQGMCTLVGGTSVASPIFAGILALVNQSLSARGATGPPGLGNINPVLYQLGRSASAAFHDIVVGDNIVPCANATPDCVNGTLGYTTGPGYDPVTGWGSVDAMNLVNAWITTGVPTTLSVSANNTSVTLSDQVQLTITVIPASGTVAPSGTVFVNQTGVTTVYTAVSVSPNVTGASPLGTATLAPVQPPGSSASATATVTIYPGALTAGTDTVLVTYGGDAAFNGSSGTITLNVSLPSGHSAVSAVVRPNYWALNTPPVDLGPPNVTKQGTEYASVITLTELAGVATTLDTFVVNGTDYSARLRTFFPNTMLAANGTLTGSIVVTPGTWTAPGPIPFVFGGQDASGYQWTTQVSVPIVGAPEQFAYIGRGGLGNAASFLPGFAPGMILSVFGAGLTPSGMGQAGRLPLPLSLAGSSATINGVSAPYYYASPGQLNIQIPYETQPGLAILTVSGGYGGQSFNYSFNVQPAAPGIFTATCPSGLCPVTPFPSGSRGGTYTIFITGEGQVTPGATTGQAPTNLPQPVLPVSMTIGEVNAPIDFIGIPSWAVGITQINFTVPTNVPLGPQLVYVTVGDAVSFPGIFTVTQ
jgi:uncharacterized protein (TIGR03437 family)